VQVSINTGGLEGEGRMAVRTEGRVKKGRPLSRFLKEIFSKGHEGKERFGEGGLGQTGLGCKVGSGRRTGISHGTARKGTKL